MISLNESEEGFFKRDLSELINRYSLENDSGTPDFIIADYLVSCLDAYNKAVADRKHWRGNR